MKKTDPASIMICSDGGIRNKRREYFLDMKKADSASHVGTFANIRTISEKLQAIFDEFSDLHEQKLQNDPNLMYLYFEEDL